MATEKILAEPICKEVHRDHNLNTAIATSMRGAHWLGFAMATMTDSERDDFLSERRLGNLAISRPDRGPLIAPIWYQYTPGGTIDICMGGSSAKALALGRAGRASMLVSDEGRPYRYVSVEGPVSISLLGDSAKATIQAMATRYLGERAGAGYAEAFSTPDEVIVRLAPEHWRTEVLG